MSQELTVKIPGWFLVLLSTLLGFALSLKNAMGIPSVSDGVILVSACTIVGFVWGCVLAWCLSRYSRQLATTPRD